MVLIASKSCQITPNNGGTCTVQSGLSTKVKVGGEYALLDGCKIQVAGGTIPGTQTKPIVIELAASAIKKLQIEGKCPIGMGDKSDGSDKAEYIVGQSTVTAPVIITVTSTGQTSVKGA